MNIYVSNLSFNVEDDDLRGFFSEYGDVTSAKVIIDKFTQRSKGFGFVEMPDNAAAVKAMAELNGSVADGRTMKVTEARPKQDAPKRSSYSKSW
jgi:RNA recognition motif-containing protein